MKKNILMNKKLVIGQIAAASVFMATCISQGAITLPIAFNDTTNGGYVGGTKLDEVNTASGQWYDGLTGIVFNDVMDLAGTGFNVGVVIEATTQWIPSNNPDQYTRVGTDDLRINLSRGQSVGMRFTFYDLANVAAPVQISNSTFGDNFEFSFAVYDLDGDTSAGLDTVTSSQHDSYTVGSTNALNITTNPDGSTTIAADATNTNGPNPPSAGYEIGLALLNFSDISQIDLTYSITDATTNGGRNFALDGNEVVFQPATPVEVVDNIPEPSTSLLLGLAGLGLMLRRR